MTNKKCNRCKVTLPASNFIKKRCGNYMKRCKQCNEKNRGYNRKNIGEFKCTHKGCNMKLSTNAHLQTHIKDVHLKIKNFNCPHVGCEYKATRNYHINIHIKRVHLKIKDVVCTYDGCEYKCVAKHILNQHIKAVHLKIKDVVCTYDGCEYKCSATGTLQTHINIVHLKEKKFKCEICSSKCTSNTNLQSHIKQVHLKIKDFECETCNQKFSLNGDLQRHIKRCTGELTCSAGEYQVMKTLDEMNIEYQYDTSYEVKSNKSWLRWDFIVDTGGELDDPIFIEYDGKQHFEVVKHFGGEKKFIKQQKHDKIKNDYCEENGYLLLRIPYNQYENIHSLVVSFTRANTDWGYE